MVWIPTLLLIALCLISPAESGAFTTSASIVPADSRISDDETHLVLARILSYDDATLKDSLAEYTILLRQSPGNAEVAVEAAGVMVRLKMFPEAASILNNIYQQNLHNVKIITSLADVECSLGHAQLCRSLYLKALEYEGQKPGLTLHFADRMNIWGDFYKAEALYRNRLQDRPDDIDVTIKLAKTLASSQRYEESEEIYQRLLAEGRRTVPVFLGLAATKLWAKDATASARYAREAMAIDNADTEAALVLAESYIITGRYPEARSVYEQISVKRGPSADILVKIGTMYLKEGNVPEASRCFEKAISIDRQNIPAQFYAHRPGVAGSGEFTGSVLRDTQLSAADLSQWASLYSSQGYFSEAIQFFDAALNKEPSYFPALIGRAEALAANRQYDDSIASYERLSRDFPGNSKIMTGHARVLAWSRKYHESIRLYKQIIALNPRDPVPRRELARTYMWAKDPSLAMDTYNEAIAHLTATQHRDKDEKAKDFSAEERIQRSLSLERDAKRLAYEKRFARSFPVYETLINENPGNEEALFDQAQVACALGLCDMEGKIYDRLLMIDPTHALALDAHDWQTSRGNPSIRFDYSYWNEEGRGDLARITRNRFDTSVDVPIHCQYHVFFKGHRWLEQPDFNHRTYGATGFSLGYSGTFNSLLNGEMSWTHKQYDNTDLGNKETGYGTLWFAAHDKLKLGLGYARTDELYNFFGIDQGIQADRLWVGFKNDITRKLELYGRGEYIHYTDSNSGTFLGLNAGYALTDHPRLFKISATGEYRNTRHDNEYIYQDGVLANIVHPYWAPRDYFAGSLILEWHHDLAKLFICGAGQHYYDIKASFGTDTENNPYAKLEGEWNFEFTKHWLVGLKGMIHSSPEWNATGAWALVRYRF